MAKMEIVEIKASFVYSDLRKGEVFYTPDLVGTYMKIDESIAVCLEDGDLSDLTPNFNVIPVKRAKLVIEV